MLAVDIGNTYTRIVAFSGDRIRSRYAFPTRDLDVAVLMAAFAEAAPEADSQAVWVSSVAPAANAAVDSAAERTGLARRFIKPGKDDIIPHRLATPHTTGCDRLLSAMAAGKRHFAGAAGSNGYVTIQCGSAATVDFVDGAGVFQGGYIIPGPAMWLSSLASAAQLPDLSSEVPDWNETAIGDNTRDAMLHGMTACLPLAVATAALRFDSAPVAVTGGWGEAVAGVFPEKFMYDSDLLLHGIRLFAERNA